MSRVSGISCSVFQKEIEKMVEQGLLTIPFKYLDSSLHIYPAKLRRQIDQAILVEQDKGNKVILIYGECHPYMSEYTSDGGVVRISGINCGNIFLGSDVYRKLQHEGAFIFLPEWTFRWQEIFIHHLGLNKKNLRSFLREMHSKFVYLDTQISPIPENVLKEISHFTGLAMEIISVSPKERLLSKIREAQERLISDG